MPTSTRHRTGRAGSQNLSERENSEIQARSRRVTEQNELLNFDLARKAHLWWRTRRRLIRCSCSSHHKICSSAHFKSLLIFISHGNNSRLFTAMCSSHECLFWKTPEIRCAVFLLWQQKRSVLTPRRMKHDLPWPIPSKYYLRPLLCDFRNNVCNAIRHTVATRFHLHRK